MPEDELSTPIKEAWGIVAVGLFSSISTVGILYLIVINFKYGPVWWILVILLSLLTIICVVLTLIGVFFLMFFKKVKHLSEEEASDEFLEVLESSIIVKILNKLMDMEAYEGEMKVVKIIKIGLDTSGLSLFNQYNGKFTTISWGDIKKFKFRFKKDITKFYYTLILINKRVVWINAEVDNRKGYEIIKNIKSSIKKYRKGFRSEEIEFTGRFDYIYFDKPEV